MSEFKIIFTAFLVLGIVTKQNVEKDLIKE